LTVCWTILGLRRPHHLVYEVGSPWILCVLSDHATFLWTGLLPPGTVPRSLCPAPGHLFYHPPPRKASGDPISGTNSLILGHPRVPRSCSWYQRTRWVMTEVCCMRLLGTDLTPEHPTEQHDVVDHAALSAGRE